MLIVQGPEFRLESEYYGAEISVFHVDSAIHCPVLTAQDGGLHARRSSTSAMVRSLRPIERVKPALLKRRGRY